ncbi:MAG TPA: zinc ribbon domain-containing protein [Deltaproteobacteria bacterium]|nr:zinc ribbon domain-containing protein [Deltaproteobacteria bacterium]
MPIYEFYCKRCNTIYNFFSKTVNTSKIPLCPKCKKERLIRQMSVFAAVTGSAKLEEKHPLDGLDEKKVEKELAKIAAEAQKIKDDDPRAAAHLMRKFTEKTGVKMGEGFYEALRRIEKGEDPDKVELEMADALMQEDPFAQNKSAKKGKKEKPSVDETLYEL